MSDNNQNSGTEQTGLGAELYRRIARRRVRRPAMGMSAAFYERFGLTDPWLPEDIDYETAEADGLVYLSITPFQRMMRRLADARLRREARLQDFLARHGAPKMRAAHRIWPGESRRSLASWKLPMGVPEMALPEWDAPEDTDGDGVTGSQHTGRVWGRDVPRAATQSPIIQTIVREVERPAASRTRILRQPAHPRAQPRTLAAPAPTVVVVRDNQGRMVRQPGPAQGAPKTARDVVAQAAPPRKAMRQAVMEAPRTRALDRVGRQLQAVLSDKNAVTKVLERLVPTSSVRTIERVTELVRRIEVLKDRGQEQQIRPLIARLGITEAPVRDVLIKEVLADQAVRPVQVAKGRDPEPEARTRGARSYRALSPLMQALEQPHQEEAEASAVRRRIQVGAAAEVVETVEVAGPAPRVRRHRRVVPNEAATTLIPHPVSREASTSPAPRKHVHRVAARTERALPSKHRAVTDEFAPATYAFARRSVATERPDSVLPRVTPTPVDRSEPEAFRRMTGLDVAPAERPVKRIRRLQMPAPEQVALIQEETAPSGEGAETPRRRVAPVATQDRGPDRKAPIKQVQERLRRVGRPRPDSVLPEVAPVRRRAGPVPTRRVVDDMVVPAFEAEQPQPRKRTQRLVSPEVETKGSRTIRAPEQSPATGQRARPLAAEPALEPRRVRRGVPRISAQRLISDMVVIPSMTPEAVVEPKRTSMVAAAARTQSGVRRKASVLPQVITTDATLQVPADTTETGLRQIARRLVAEQAPDDDGGKITWQLRTVHHRTTGRRRPTVTLSGNAEVKPVRVRPSLMPSPTAYVQARGEPEVAEDAPLASRWARPSLPHLQVPTSVDEETAPGLVPQPKRRRSRMVAPVQQALARDPELVEEVEDDVGRRPMAKTLGQVAAGDPGQDAPGWAQRSTGTPRIRGAEELVQALARASAPDEVMKVIVERRTELKQMGTQLPAPMGKLVRQIQTEAERGPERRTRPNRQARQPRRMSGLSAGFMLGLSRQSAANQQAGTSRLTGLTKQLQDLILLAESDRNAARDHVRMKEGEHDHASEGAAVAPAGAQEETKVDVDALSRDVLAAVGREFDLRKELGWEDNDGWW